MTVIIIFAEQDAETMKNSSKSSIPHILNSKKIFYSGQSPVSH